MYNDVNGNEEANSGIAFPYLFNNLQRLVSVNLCPALFPGDTGGYQI